MSRVRDTVLASLAAIGARSEATFYAERFAELEPERFAFLVIDPRAMQGPLLEAFISNVRLLADLDLTPIVVLGVLDEDQTHVSFQSQKLTRELTDAGVGNVRLNTATYGLMSEIRKVCDDRRIPILEITNTRNRLDLPDLVDEIRPNKVIFLQPSGGLMQSGRRISVINIDSDRTEDYVQSIGQSQFVELVTQMLRQLDTQTHYVMASPLNLIAELFTEKGSGTMIRRGAVIKDLKTYRSLDTDLIQSSMEAAFGQRLDESFFRLPIERIFIETDYRGGAILRNVDAFTYLTKFWVSREARGEGLARDIWNALTSMPTGVSDGFVWRSRHNNRFNAFYIEHCDGMQRHKDWMVFWRGVGAERVASAIEAVVAQPVDFKTESSLETSA